MLYQLDNDENVLTNDINEKIKKDFYEAKNQFNQRLIECKEALQNRFRSKYLKAFQNLKDRDIDITMTFFLILLYLIGIIIYNFITNNEVKAVPILFLSMWGFELILISIFSFLLYSVFLELIDLFLNKWFVKRTKKFSDIYFKETKNIEEELEEMKSKYGSNVKYDDSSDIIIKIENLKLENIRWNTSEERLSKLRSFIIKPILLIVASLISIGLSPLLIIFFIYIIENNLLLGFFLAILFEKILELLAIGLRMWIKQTLLETYIRTLENYRIEYSY